MSQAQALLMTVLPAHGQAGQGSQSVRPGRSFCPAPPSTFAYLLLCAPFTGPSSLVAPRICPTPCDDPCPLCHLTPFLRHIGEARIPEPSRPRSWQQLQEADPAQVSGVTPKPSRLPAHALPHSTATTSFGSLCAQPRAAWAGRTPGTGGGSLGF